MHSTTLLGLLAAAVSVTAKPCAPKPPSTGTVKCPLVFDGRVKTTAVPTDFDSADTSIFNPGYVKGNDLEWSDILQFPEVANARFDDAAYKPFEVTISDESIFMTQQGFRRAGLQFKGDENEASPSSEGVKTLHFSLKWDAQRALNTSHEYILTWSEQADYAANQFNFQTGAIIGQDLPKDTYKLLDRNNKQLWSTPIVEDAWQNFAITIDFEEDTLQMYYSKGAEPLKSVTEAISNDNSGDGQFQMGLLKKPTGTDDVVNSGYQSSNLDEGLIYGSLFLEDSADGCISL